MIQLQTNINEKNLPKQLKTKAKRKMKKHHCFREKKCIYPSSENILRKKKKKKRLIELPSKTSDTAIYFTQPNNKS